VGNIDTKIINLSSVSFVKGNLKFNGSVSVDASGKKPHIRGSLVGDSVVLPAKAGAKSGDASSSKGGAMFSDEPLPFDAFDLVNADLGLKIGHLKSGNIVLDNINATVKLSNGVLALIPLNAAFAGGQISSNITLSKASTRINLKGANLSMEKILAQIAGFDDFKNGVTNADIALSGSGDSLAKIAGSLSGSTHVSMGAATYSGEILKGRAAQFSQLLYGDSGSRTLVINCVLTDINWVNGAGTFQKLGVDTKYANINGSGNIRLASETLNLVLTPVSKLPKLNNLAIPIGVSGTFGNPQISEKKIIENVAQTVGQNVLKDFLAAKQSGDKFKFNLKKAAGIDKNATIASPCGAAPVTVPAAAEKAVPTTEVAPAAEAAPQVQQQPAPTMEPERPLTKKEKKAQKINDALKQFGF